MLRWIDQAPEEFIAHPVAGQRGGGPKSPDRTVACDGTWVRSTTR